MDIKYKQVARCPSFLHLLQSSMLPDLDKHVTMHIKYTHPQHISLYSHSHT
ncbi:hypothetical protein HanHA300_Chr05g0167371 [Helianthus annuus]|nr:hypothetical protein HanHA300_Chr05g0167371 [Helianthus annuus]KAJ0583851.1 hypothetical protein HanHA89_Chr05g0181431 [Helianthus annuus]